MQFCFRTPYDTIGADVNGSKEPYMSTGKVREKDTDKGGQSVFDKMVEALMQEQSEEGLRG